VRQDSFATSPFAEEQVLSPLEAYWNLDAADPILLPQQENRLMLSHLAETVPLEVSLGSPSYFGDIESTWHAHGPSPMTSIVAQGENALNTVEGSKIPWKEEDTTLCSVAFSLIMSSNKKGYSTADLDLKLRVGYRYEHATFEGCRIDNRTLLRVLTEIV
jgi:hypothetical protein